jgi:hypothetical protein
MMDNVQKYNNCINILSSQILDAIERNISSGFHDNGYRNVYNFGALSVIPGNGGRPFEMSFWLTLTGHNDKDCQSEV